MANNSWCAVNPVSYTTLLQYCCRLIIIAIILYSYITVTQCRRAIASILIHAVVLCESAQQYRALMVILQSQNMILRCYSNVSAILRRHTKSCLLCFFNNPYIPPFEFTEFFIYLSLLFFTYFTALHSSRSFAPPKKWLFYMYMYMASSARAAHAHACVRRAQALGA